MQQVYAYYELSRLDCELLLEELVKRGLEIVQFQIIKEAEVDYSLFVVVRPGTEDAWLEETLENVKLYRSMGS